MRSWNSTDSRRAVAARAVSVVAVDTQYTEGRRCRRAQLPISKTTAMQQNLGVKSLNKSLL